MLKNSLLLLCLLPLSAVAHTLQKNAGKEAYTEELRQHIADEFMARRQVSANTPSVAAKPKPFRLQSPVQVASTASAFNLAALLSISSYIAPAGNGSLMAASFAPFKPKVRFFWDSTYFYEESDGMPDRTRMPNLMVGITSWQQQVPLPTSYFASTTNSTNDTGSLGYGQPNYWKIPLVPVPAASPIAISSGNFQRGAIALAADGVPIFNPANNTGRISYEIGELDAYGGHCGLGDDYHYHIAPVHLIPVLGNDKPIAWALDGYPMYGYVEPDGSTMQVLDSDGGHTHGSWGYHYHARGTYNSGTGKWTPSAPYMNAAFHGTVVNYGGQVDPQPTGSGLRGSGTGGYTASPVSGASIIAFKNPVALSIDGSGHFVENVSGTPSNDDWLMRISVSGVSYDICWRLNRSANPKTMTITWRLPGATTTTIYNNSGNRITAYTMAAASMTKLPDTSQTLDTTTTFGEDADYSINAQSFTDNGNGTITDNITGLMWQKVDNGESTWETAVSNAAGITTGGYTDWRLPTPSELFSILNHNNGNPAAIDTTYFPNNPNGTAGYWWSSDLYGSSTTNVWCTNAGGGLGPKPKTETISAGGSLRYNARYVRGAKPTNGHNYLNNNDGTITDLDTGLMWQQVPGSTVTLDNALSYAENLSLAGYTDWRLPNVKELQTLTDYTLATATSTSGIKASINRTLFPTATATAYWSSTTVKGSTTTEAWLLETGINSSANPQRNSQGIISYEVKTAAYPVFAVRTTSVTTQIAVDQGGNALTDGVSTVSYGSVNVGSTASKTYTITNNGSTSLTISGATIDGANASNFTITAAPAGSIAAGASTTLVVQFSAVTSGTKLAALHIASSDSAVGAAFDIALSGVGYIPPPTITNVTVNPTVPSNTDTPYVTATVTPSNGATITSVQMTYSTGAQVTAAAYQEIFSNGSTASGLAGAMNSWTTTNVRAATDVKQRGGTSNRTTAIVLANCATNSNTTVTCTSTTGLIPGMLISGTNIPSGATISSVTNGTTFVISSAATATGTGLSLTAAGVTLTGCTTTSASNSVTCLSTNGLAVGMGIAGVVTNPPNPTIATITPPTTFTLNNNVTTGAANVTLTATGTGLDFSNGTPNLTDTMAATTNVISATAPTTGNVEFYVRNADLLNNNGWTFQISPDGGTTWNTRLSETYASKSVALNNCTLNGTTTVTCASTTGLVAGMTVQGRQVAVSCGTTNASPTVTCTNTSGLAVGMFVYGTGITSGTRITAITANTNFTLSANATVTNASAGLLANTMIWLTGCGTTNTSPTVNCTNTTGLVVGMYIAGTGIPNNTAVTAITANTNFTLSANATATGTVPATGSYLNTTATVATITNGTTFTLNAAPVMTGTGFSLDAVSLNHGFPASPYHYDLVAGDMSANMKMRFQFSGYTSLGAPLRPATVDIDDITVTLTTGAAPVTVQMFDDGLHGDGAAGDSVYGVQIPAQVSGTTVSYSIAATDSGSQVTTLSSAGSYTTGFAPIITSSATLPNATPNIAYSTTLAATGGSGGNVWGVLTGALPSGLTLSSGGVISGTTSAQGTFIVTIKVTDSAGRIGTKAFTLTVTTTTAPNVVIILTDDQGWADVGYHTPAGQVPIQTPNMDRFGTDGIRLEKFYPTTVCAVTRGCLLTGRNSLRTGVGNQKGLNVVEHTMPQTFKSAGYQTFMCGKWHIGGWDNNIYTTSMNGATIDVQQEGFDYHPIARGWDFHKGQYGGAINYFTHTTSDPGKNTAIDWWQNNVQLLNDNTDLQGNGGYSTDLLADKAVELIQTRDTSKPMLLYLAFNAIHAGVSAPTSYLNKYSTLGVTGNRRTIAAAVDCMDVAMGRVLAALDNAGITNNTLVIFMSDNGGDTSTGSLNTPLRGTKSDSYEGGLHTPAGIRWPGRLAAGVTSNQYIWVGDMFPTICAAVGVTPQNTKPFDGVNLWPALQSITPAAPDGAPRGVPLVTGDAGEPVALNLLTDPISSTTKMFKLIRTPGTTVVNELFNLTDDPYETTDLLLGGNAASYASTVTTLTSAITGIATENYPPNFGISGIAQTVVAGGNITLYAPFTSYKNAPTVQWKKGGTNVTSSTPFYQVTNGAASVAGVYMATLPFTNVSATDAGSYTATATNTTGNNTTPGGTLTVVTAPVLNALPAYTAGTNRSIIWPAITGATDYNVQIATNSGFTTGLSSQTVATNTATFTGLTSSTLYYYRATSNYNATSTPYGNTVSATQDATNPAVALTTAAGNTTRSSLQITGAASDGDSGLANVTVNGVTATITSGNWSSSVPLNLGSNTITATATDNAGNTAVTSITVTRNASTQNDGLPDSWKVANGIPLTNDPANGPTGDIDKDGRQNLLEYAFNTNAQANDVSPFQGMPATKAGDGLKYLEVSYPRRIGALDLIYTVEVSDDLTTWPSPGSTTEPVSIVPTGNGVTETVTVRILPAIGSTAKKFVRIRVTTQ